MTLGERIQNLRKEKGLSQEALGEVLGVSRQAVSQWESGSSRPEVEKLRDLAGALGVTVGYLLGDGPAQGAADGLTDRDWKAVEAVAARCLAATEPVKRPRWAVLPWASLILAALALLLALRGPAAPAAPEPTPIPSPAPRFELETETLWEEGGALADCTAGIKQVDFSAGTIQLDLSARPAQVGENTAVSFLLEGERMDPLTIPGESADGLTFTAGKVELPLPQSLRLSVLLEEGGGTRVQPAYSWPKLAAFYTPSLDLAYEGSCFFREEDQTLVAEGTLLLGLTLDGHKLLSGSYTPERITVDLRNMEREKSGGPPGTSLGPVAWDGPFVEALPLAVPISIQEELLPGRRVEVWADVQWTRENGATAIGDPFLVVLRDEDGTVHFLRGGPA